MKEQKIALFDLDSTLVRYMPAMLERLNLLKSPGEPSVTFEDTLGQNDHLYRRRKEIQRTPGFWRDLTPHGPGFDVFNMAKAAGFTRHILTKAPKDTPNAWSEKLEWRNMWVPEVKMTISEDKSLVRGALLVEDWPDYYLPWLEAWPEGQVIIIDHPWNKNHNHMRSTRYTGDNKDQIITALETAYKL